MDCVKAPTQSYINPKFLLQEFFSFFAINNPLLQISK